MAVEDRIILSAEAMREADRRTIEEFGLPSFALMETASRGVASVIERRMGSMVGRKVLVLAGAGNNGGDGLAVARLLAQRGAAVFVFVHGGASAGSAETALNLKLLRRFPQAAEAALEVHEFRVAEPTPREIARATEALEPWGRFDLALDALVGIGAKGALRGPVAAMAEFAVRADTVAALDVPSGIETDTGERLGHGGITANFTVAIAATKPCHWFGEGPATCGEVEVVDIGIPPHIIEASLGAQGSARIAGTETVRRFLGGASQGSHKFAVGQAAVVAGSDRYSGALILASRAAGQSGAGYVVCASTERAAAALDAQSPETVAIRFQSAKSGTLRKGAAAAILEEFRSARACLVGPGLGYSKDESTKKEIAGLVLQLVKGCQVPLVIDADGLNALDSKEAIKALCARKAPTVLTPHPKEFRRLVAASGAPYDVDERQRRPTWLASEWAQYFGATLVLKGSLTVIASPDGRTFVAPHGSRALATAGTGDVLSGSITGLLAQGLGALEASVAAVHIGLVAASAYAAEGNSSASCQASDIVDRLSQARHALS